MLCHIIDEQQTLKISSEQVEQIIQQVLKEENCTCDEVSVTFVDTACICQLHKDFFDDDSPTDCISLPMDMEEDETYRILGEIFVCTDTAIQYANEHGGTALKETTLYIVHGLLHLMGYDDLDESDYVEMQAAEKRHMKVLGDLGLVL